MKPTFLIITHFLKITFPNLWQVLGARRIFKWILQEHANICLMEGVKSMTLKP